MWLFPLIVKKKNRFSSAKLQLKETPGKIIVSIFIPPSKRMFLGVYWNQLVNSISPFPAMFSKGLKKVRVVKSWDCVVNRVSVRMVILLEISTKLLTFSKRKNEQRNYRNVPEIMGFVFKAVK